MAKVITTEEFRELDMAGLVVVDFYAEWCGPCKMLGPIYEEVSQLCGEKASFYKVDIDQSMELAQEYQITTVPTLLFFKDGVIVHAVTGFISKAQLEQLIEQLV